MSILMELNEGTAGRRAVPFRLFTSNGTAPDTGASNDSIVMAINSATTIVPNVVVAASNANQGMYYVTLLQSNLSVLGTHSLYHTQGDFPQHIATVQVVNSNPFSSFSNIGAGAYSGVTVDVRPASLLSYDMGNTRYFQDMFMAIRNKVDASSSVGTVYLTNDSTSCFTFSLTTAANGIVSVDPAT